MKVRIWGARGSVPAPGPEMNRYGGNTSCVEVTLAVIGSVTTALLHQPVCPTIVVPAG